jgi:hypothetical protein
MDLLQSFRQKFWIILAIILLITTGISSYLALTFYNRLPPSQRVLGATAQIAPQEANDLEYELSKLIILPVGEQPTIAQIVDIKSLQDQNPSFYQFAQNGDTVLVFSTRAVIYRRSEGKIVNIAPIDRKTSQNS